MGMTSPTKSAHYPLTELYIKLQMVRPEEVQFHLHPQQFLMGAIELSMFQPLTAVVTIMEISALRSMMVLLTLRLPL